MSSRIAYTADRLFTGHEWLNWYAVVANGDQIEDLLPLSDVPSALQVQHFDDCFLAPAFIDLQIYGAHGRLLAVYPDTQSLDLLVDYCRQGGAAWCLPTVATNTLDVFHASINAVRAYWKSGGAGVLGLHLEGPWINPVKRGAHIASLIHAPQVEEVKALLDAGEGVIKMITLAPEVCSPEIIEMILSRNIVISAGHSNATYTEARKAFDTGIKTVTHLYNAMSPLQHREPGLVGATMDDPRVCASIIPDGYHADHAAIRIAKQVMKERLFVITDAVTDTAEGYYPHQLAGDKYISGGILSGSSLTMDRAVKNLVNETGIETGEALRMCSLYPAQVIGIADAYGRIAKGFKKALVAMNEQSLQATHLITGV